MSNQYVVFKIGEQNYAIDIFKVKIIERISDFTRVPNAPNYIKGIINLRGDVVPVMDLRVRFGMESKIDKENSRIIIIKYEELVVGLIVDSSSEVINLDLNEIDNPPNVGDFKQYDYINGIGKKDERMIMILDVKKVLELQ
ncbi:chemotaxis protein CheW [Abyssisolibacter fermentans]|uniref:chemotaxis protein CheW n=1 Tax=Abyssisolibacter fermentans TaxID=1766203 RepID=UPI000B20F05B